MRPLERQAFLQLAWVLGHQNHEYHDSSAELTNTAGPDESPWWQVHAVENRLLVALEARMAKLTGRWPQWRSQPATTDEEDEEVANGQNRVLRHYWREVLDMDEQLWAAHWFAEATGTSFLLTVWDPDSGPMDTVTPERFGAPGDADGGLTFFREIFGDTVGDQVKRPVGDVAVEVLTLFEVFPDPSVRRLKDARFVILSRLRSMDYMLDRYNRSEVDKLELGVSAGDVPFHGKLLGLSGGSGWNDNENPLQDLFLTHELWVPPASGYPEGLHAVMAEDVLLRSQPYPYDHGHLPLSSLQGIPVPTSIWGTSVVAQLMESQDLLNDLRSTKVEYWRMHVYPKLMTPVQASLHEDAMTTEFGEIVEFQGSLPPHYLTPPPIPQYLESQEDRQLRAFEDLASIHEVTQATAPQGTKSGRAIIALQAQDDAKFGPVIRLRNKTLGVVGGQVLALLRQFATERRFIQISGDEFEREIGLFRDMEGFIGDDLVGKKEGRAGIDYYRVYIDQESGLPLSPEGQRVIISDLAESGFLNPQTDRDMVLRLHGLASADPLIQQERVHRARAVLENRSMATGRRSDPKVYEGHIVHLRVHQRYMNGTEFRRLSSETQKMFELHVARHSLLQATELQRPQLTMQMAQPIAQSIVQSEMEAIRQEGPAPPDFESVSDEAVESFADLGAIPGQQPQQAAPIAGPDGGLGAQNIPEINRGVNPNGVAIQSGVS